MSLVFEGYRQDPATYALGRRPWRTYASRSFPLGLPNSRDAGSWARYVHKVFDEPEEWIQRGDDASGLEWKEERIKVTPGGRRQLSFQIAREAGAVRQIDIEEVVDAGTKNERLRRVLRLDREASKRFLGVVEAIRHIPVQGVEQTVRIDDEIIQDFFGDSEAMRRLYEGDRERFRALISSDASAQDVVAMAHRRAMVDRFRRLLNDDEFFKEAQGRGGPEGVWQRFLEANPWILGVSLAGPLLTSWDPEKLERVVADQSVTGPGKRVDALLETTGRIRALVFAEIKHHNTKLLEPDHYRSGCWAPTRELSGAVAQSQRTVDMALDEIGDRLRKADSEGNETGEATHFVRPRSFLIAGNLDELRSEHGVHVAKYRSFELYRRNLHEPEILTYDELLARAEWHVSMAEDRTEHV